MHLHSNDFIKAHTGCRRRTPRQKIHPDQFYRLSAAASVITRPTSTRRSLAGGLCVSSALSVVLFCLVCIKKAPTPPAAGRNNETNYLSYLSFLHFLSLFASGCFLPFSSDLSALSRSVLFRDVWRAI